MTIKETNDQIVYSVGIEEGLRPLLAEFLVAQANHESASYTSAVFLRCNNAFGYKYVGQELAISGCSKSPEDSLHYAKYASLADSAREVARWIKRRGTDFDHVQTPEQYAKVMEENAYFTGNLSIYQRAIAKFWNPIKGAMNVAITKYPTETILTGVTFFTVLTYTLWRVFKKK